MTKIEGKIIIAAMPTRVGNRAFALGQCPTYKLYSCKYAELPLQSRGDSPTIL